MLTHFFNSSNKTQTQKKNNQALVGQRVMTEQDDKVELIPQKIKIFAKMLLFKQKFQHIQTTIMNSYQSDSITCLSNLDEDSKNETKGRKNKLENSMNELKWIGNQNQSSPNFLNSCFQTPLVSNPIWNEQRSKIFKIALSPESKSKNYFTENFLKTSESVVNYKLPANRSQEVVSEENPIEQLKAGLINSSSSLFSDQKTEQRVSQLKRFIEKCTVQDLMFLDKLGYGQYGRVYLVKFKGSDQLLALKYVSKRTIQELGIYKQMQQELFVLQNQNNPFIMKFYRSYKDDQNIYFLTEYIAGFELFDAIRIIGLLSKKICQFYVAQMILQIEYLHKELNVVYRDLKPENLMVDNEGYLKLIDMGSAKGLKTKCGIIKQTYTIIGTPHYMAPEIIQGSGYNYLVDLWSLGICFYEFVCGGLPFGEDKDDPFEIYNNIIQNQLSFNCQISDKSAIPLIRLLLHKSPQLRLNGSYDSLKSHQWFNDFDWDQLIQRKLKPPVLPPSERIHNPGKLKQLEKQQISVMEQISIDTKEEKKLIHPSNFHNWDSIF